MPELKIDKRSTAVLAMDFQNNIVAMSPQAQQNNTVASAAQVVAAARRAGVPVFFVVVQFREGYPEISPRNALFSGIKAGGILKRGTPGADIPTLLKPLPQEPVIVKPRVSAFFNSDLDVLLRSAGIDTLALMGISTNHVVESTARYAADADYRVLIIAEGCAGLRPEDHEYALKNILPNFATVVSAADFIRALS